MSCAWRKPQVAAFTWGAQAMNLRLGCGVCRLLRPIILSFDDSGDDMGVISDLTGLYTTLYIREGINTQIGTSGTQFDEYKLTIRSRVRAALVIRRATSHVRLIKADTP